ncbi:hypothetical protein DAERI_180016 [Deinococcus aerius]|uniref:Uncharacterized protein n=1 Tax=Deinococcus aerius TaxID=200253 RepID=A0A2I9E259_9DEIO|nr:hypothetical protein [Deinococcus aerius]GBF07825.1 hypothetical protein DAERI_180016 [Deinococcus aerius]
MNDALLDALRQQAGRDAAGADPVLGLLSQMLAQREQSLTRDLEARGQEEGHLEAEARAAQEARRLEDLRGLEEEQRQAARLARLERLRFRLETLEGGLATAQARLDDLALALGACPNCWGEDPECRLCRGRGQPGFLRPEAAAFRRLVVPALKAASRHPEPRAFAGEERPAPERTTL